MIAKNLAESLARDPHRITGGGDQGVQIDRGDRELYSLQNSFNRIVGNLNQLAPGTRSDAVLEKLVEEFAYSTKKALTSSQFSETALSGYMSGLTRLFSHLVENLDESDELSLALEASIEEIFCIVEIAKTRCRNVQKVELINEYWEEAIPYLDTVFSQFEVSEGDLADSLYDIASESELLSPTMSFALRWLPEMIERAPEKKDDDEETHFLGKAVENIHSTYHRDCERELKVREKTIVFGESLPPEKLLFDSLIVSCCFEHLTREERSSIDDVTSGRFVDLVVEDKCKSTIEIPLLALQRWAGCIGFTTLLLLKDKRIGCGILTLASLVPAKSMGKIIGESLATRRVENLASQSLQFANRISDDLAFDDELLAMKRNLP